MSVSELMTRSIEQQLDELAAIKRDPAAGGITREVFTDEYTQANDHVAALMRSAGSTFATMHSATSSGGYRAETRQRQRSSPARTSTRPSTLAATTACSV